MKLSVLMSVYSGEKPEFLSQCLESFATQTLPADEIILVKDGYLTNDLEKVISFYLVRLPIKIVSLSKNSGLAVALNAGLQVCKGEFVARMDTDDILLPDRFLSQITYMETHPEVDLVGCFAIEVNENGVEAGVRRMPIKHDAIVSSLWSNPFIHPAVMFKRDKMLAIGGYDVKLRRRQDYELWFRCAREGFNFSNISQPLILYRFVAGTHKKQTASLAWAQAIIGFKGASALKMPVWKRLACFVPFIRSLLPIKLQHWLYRVMKRFDPRQQRAGD